MADEDKDAKIPATGGESNGEEKNDVVVKIGLVGDAQVNKMYQLLVHEAILSLDIKCFI